MTSLDSALTIGDLKERARRRVPKQFFDYSESGSWTEQTFRANESDYADVLFRQRVAVDLRERSLATTIVDQPVSMPVAVAPAAICGLQIADGEIHAARAAAKAGIPFSLSTMSICSIEDVAEAVETPFWFQLYMMRDRGYVRELLQRARQVGVDTLVFTVDLAVVGSRYRDTRNGMGGLSGWASVRSALNFAAHPRWLVDVALGGRPLVFGNLASYVASAKNVQQFRSWIDSQFDPSVTWKDIEWLRREWPGTLIIKGILEPGDARYAADAGAQGIVVSNHGGRQLDSAPSSISALPMIADAVGDRLEVLMDGGVHTGQDVAKALALGARSVMIGRAWVFALAARGEAGVRNMLASLQRELTVTLALTGVTRLADLSAEVLRPASQ